MSVLEAMYFFLSLSFYNCKMGCNSSYILGPLWKSPLDSFAKYLQNAGNFMLQELPSINKGPELCGKYSGFLALH